jgi:secreted trypsin-like serine protease
VGIVSWGIGCGGKIPAVYADVVGAAEWIHDKVNQRIKETSDYFEKQLPLR